VWIKELARDVLGRQGIEAIDCCSVISGSKGVLLFLGDELTLIKFSVISNPSVKHPFQIGEVIRINVSGK